MLKNDLTRVAEAAMACMAKVSFTPEHLITLIGISVISGIAIGILGTLVYGCLRTVNQRKNSNSDMEF